MVVAVNLTQCTGKYILCLLGSVDKYSDSLKDRKTQLNCILYSTPLLEHCHSPCVVLSPMV